MAFPKGASYIVLAFSLWILVEYVTVWIASPGEWLAHMPWIFFQYLAIVLLFWLVLLVREWSQGKVFLLMVIVMYTFELAWHNHLLLSLEWFLPASILLAQIWGFLTFVPYWVVNRSTGRQKGLAVFVCLWPLTGFALALVT